MTIVLNLTGCSVKQVKVNNTINSVKQSQGSFETVSPSRDKFFINSNEGWKATYKPLGSYNEDMALYITKDGGKTWIKIANTEDKESTLPGGDKIGMSFISPTKGWITQETPQAGSLNLFRTLNGGVTWIEQKPQIPRKFQQSEFYTVPPLFFSTSEGILLTQTYVNNESGFLFYITKDGGEDWILMPENENGKYGEIKWNFKKDTLGNTYEVIYHNFIWTLVNGTWINKKDN